MFAPDRVAGVGTAEETGTPILPAQGNTRTIIDRVEEIVRNGRTRDPATVDRMGELLTDSTDPDAVLALGA